MRRSPAQAGFGDGHLFTWENMANTPFSVCNLTTPLRATLATT